MSQQPIMTKEHLRSLQQFSSGYVPFCRGVLPVTPNDLLLYYGKGENASRISLFDPPSESLGLLEKACDPATFGRNKDDVYDESYRKAKKLNADSFMVGLDVVKLGLINVIRENLILGEKSARPVRAELYNLNVYGEGSFFKAHVDTPRSTQMFGSLVVLFPTPFEGGELIMRKEEKEWSFDAAQALAECHSPHLAYVALYSDVEHEVSMVKSGHRISVTYNLYFDDDAPAPIIPLFLSPNALGLKNALEALLLDATFLPEGGWLGFNLEHKYPVETYSGGTYFDLDEIRKCLKGVDADIARVAKKLSLPVSLRAFVSANRKLIAFQGPIPDLTDVSAEDIAEKAGAVDLKNDVQVYWVTQPSKLNQYEPVDVRGNQPSEQYEYKSFCLFIEVGRPGMRTTPPIPAARTDSNAIADED
ncbi:hypothetical protein F5887DRAFT_1157051 [Amanita rubescens]|nr:hypothetical protein F5887DRAFT_1157051 [Amanita rubescens]